MAEESCLPYDGQKRERWGVGERICPLSHTPSNLSPLTRSQLLTASQLQNSHNLTTYQTHEALEAIFELNCKKGDQKLPQGNRKTQQGSVYYGESRVQPTGDGTRPTFLLNQEMSESLSLLQVSIQYSERVAYFMAPPVPQFSHQDKKCRWRITDSLQLDIISICILESFMHWGCGQSPHLCSNTHTPNPLLHVSFQNILQTYTLVEGVQRRERCSHLAYWVLESVEKEKESSQKCMCVLVCVRMCMHGHCTFKNLCHLRQTPRLLPTYSKIKILTKMSVCVH